MAHSRRSRSGLAAALIWLAAGSLPASATLPPRSDTTGVVARATGDTSALAHPPLTSGFDAGFAGALERGVIGAAALQMMVGLDVPVRHLSRDIQGSTGDQLSRHVRWLGDWHASLAWFVGGTVAVGAVTSGKSGLRAAAAILAGAAAGSAANEVLNELVGRARPLWGRGEFSFRPLSGHASFPSGHAAYTFAMAGAVDEATSGWVPAAVGYTLAGATALSRVYDDKHWLSDIVVGAAIGTVVSRVTTRRMLGLLGGGSGPDPGAGKGAGAPGGHGAARPASPDERAPGSPPGLRARLLVSPTCLGVRLTF